MKEIEKELERISDMEIRTVDIRLYNSRGIFKRGKEWTTFIMLNMKDNTGNQLVYTGGGDTAIDSLHNAVDKVETNRKWIHEAIGYATNSVQPK